jgi:hypothetical protein
MDYDSVTQTYEESSDGSASLACPTPPKGCVFDHAFGLSVVDPQESQSDNAATRIWKLGGGQGAMPVPPLAGLTTVDQFIMMANLIEAAGPTLTPQTVQARASSLGLMGGGTTLHTLLGFGPGNWQWAQDVRVAYWDRTKKSSFNGNPGTWIQIEGPRYNYTQTQFPVMNDGPPVPGALG